MYILTEKQYQIEAEPILRQVFINEDPFDEPFSPNVNSRMLVYPLYDWTGSIFLKALIKAASDIGDREIYLSLLWRVAKIIS